jgi:homogentisate phytyltransferase/homogentisate geranylgeranyltransferase
MCTARAGGADNLVLACRARAAGRSAVVAGMYSPSVWCRYILVAAHALMARSLWAATRATDASSGASLTATYMFIWKLFYAEYALLPLFGR